jgi:hypothetical protein
MKSINRLVNLIKTINVVCDKIVNLEFTNDYLINKLWYVLSCLPSTESSALPASSSNKLERSSLDFFASCSDSNYTALAETSVSSLKSSSHDSNIASAVISEVDAPLLLREKPIL